MLIKGTLKKLSGTMLLLLLWCAGSLAGPVAVVVDEPHRDLGKVEPNDVQHLTFQLRNDGDELLMIEDVEPTCYCTSSKLGAWDLQPGETTTLSMRIDPSDFVGHVTKGVEIATNDPDNPKVLVDADMFVLPGIAVMPPELDFGDVPAEGIRRSKQIDVKAPRERNFEVERVTSDAPYLELDHEPLDLEERHGAMVFVKMLPGAPSGAFEATVVVHTTDEERPTIEVPVRGRGPGGLSVKPARIMFPAAVAGEEVGRFEVHGAKDITATSSNEGLNASVETLANGIAQIVLRLTDQARPGRLMAKVQVSSNDNETASVEVPVMGTVR